MQHHKLNDKLAAVNDGDRKPLWQRLAWLVAIWCASVVTLAVVAFVLRLLMNAAGLQTP